MEIKQIRSFNLELEERRILIRLGSRTINRKVNDFLQHMIAEESDKLKHLLEPAAIYASLDYSETDQHPIFQDAEKVALCVCTIGTKLEEKSSGLMKRNEGLRAVILDAMGSEAVEAVARQSERIIVEKARSQGLWPSKRFSPGYKNWSLRGQRFIFQNLPTHKIGVRLTDSFVMIPRKSLSFRINLYARRELSTRRDED